MIEVACRAWVVPRRTRPDVSRAGSAGRRQHPARVAACGLSHTSIKRSGRSCVPPPRCHDETWRRRKPHQNSPQGIEHVELSRSESDTLCINAEGGESGCPRIRASGYSAKSGTSWRASIRHAHDLVNSGEVKESVTQGRHPRLDGYGFRMSDGRRTNAENGVS